jgi:hypothetical protein
MDAARPPVQCRHVGPLGQVPVAHRQVERLAAASLVRVQERRRPRQVTLQQQQRCGSSSSSEAECWQ